MYCTVETIKEMNSSIQFSLSDPVIEDLIESASRIIDSSTGVEAEYYDTLDAVPPEVQSAVILLVNYNWRTLSSAGISSESAYGRSVVLESPATINRRLKFLLNKFDYDPQKYTWTGWDD